MHVQRLWISQVMLWNSGVIMSDIAKAWNLHTDNQHPDDKRIVQGDNIHNFIKIHEWDIVNIIYLRKLPWNQPWFENAQKLLFEIKVDFKDDLKSRLKFMSWLEILGCFQNEPESLFLSLLMQFRCLWKIYLCLLTQNCTHNHVVTFTNTLRHLIKIYDRLNFRQASRSSRLVNLGNSMP